MSANRSKLKNITTIVTVLYAVVMVFIAISMFLLSERDYSFSGILSYIFMAAFILGLFIGLKFPLSGAISCILFPLYTTAYFIYYTVTIGPETLELAGSGIGFAISLFVPPILFYLTWREIRKKKAIDGIHDEFGI